MTPTEIETAARQKYNSVGDTFWSQAEILTLLYEKCLEMATESLCIERTFTSESVADQAEYDWPTYAIAIKRIEYEGAKVHKIDDRDFDALNLFNSEVTISGTPQYYKTWDSSFILHPAPDASGDEIKVYAYVQPQSISIGSTLEIPTQFHMDLVNGIVEEMCLKDENESMAMYYGRKWAAGKLRAKQWQRKQRRQDSFASTKDEETLPVTLLGSR